MTIAAAEMRESVTKITVKEELGELRRPMPKLKMGSNVEIKSLSRPNKESSAMIVELKEKVKKIKEELKGKEKELQTSRKLFDQRELELDQLKEEVKYKNQRLASTEIETETCRRTTEVRIFELEAKIKELEAKARKP